MANLDNVYTKVTNAVDSLIAIFIVHCFAQALGNGSIGPPVWRRHCIKYVDLHDHEHAFNHSGAPFIMLGLFFQCSCP